VASNDKNRSGGTAHNFHKILNILLKPVLDLQEDGIPNFSHRIGDRLEVVTLLVPLFLVLADGLKGDKIAARKVYYTDVIHICSRCNCCYEDADNVDVKCKFLWRELELKEITESKSHRIGSPKMVLTVTSEPKPKETVIGELDISVYRM
jgi:hypothetical protein